MAERAINKNRVLAGANLGQVREGVEPITDPKEAVDQLIDSYRQLRRVTVRGFGVLPQYQRVNVKIVSSSRKLYREEIQNRYDRCETALLEVAFLFGNRELIKAMVGGSQREVVK